MNEYGPGHPTAHGEASRGVSVPFLVVASVLCGAGLFGMAYWLVTFQWIYFASVIPLIGGACMLFTRGTGPDHA